MPVRIRLQRHGKKGKPFYWIVAADSRTKRDGRYLEKIGTYNPNINPAQVSVDVDLAVSWLQNGAQPSDTARNILSDKGVMMKNHLINGIAKGAHSEEEAQAKFESWLAQKEAKTADKIAGLDKKAQDERTKLLEAEKAISEKRKVDAAAALAEETAQDTPATTAEEPTVE